MMGPNLRNIVNQAMRTANLPSMSAVAAAMQSEDQAALEAINQQCPTADALDELADALEVNVDDLIAAAEADGCTYTDQMMS